MRFRRRILLMSRLTRMSDLRRRNGRNPAALRVAAQLHSIGRMRLVPGLLALSAAVLLGGANLIDQGEVHCEEAVNHLDACCHAPIDRTYSCTAGRGCDDKRPDLDDPLATQIRDESCADLVASGACQTPPVTPVPTGTPCDSWVLLGQCGDNVPPPDLAVDDLASPADLSSLDAASGDGP